MAAKSDYVNGTITLTNGSVDFTGAGTGWLLAEFGEGDTIIDVTGATEFMGVVATIDANGSGTLTKAWEGPTVTADYRMRYQADGARMGAQARHLIELLGNGNLLALAGQSGSANMVPMFTGPGAITLVPKGDFISGVAVDKRVNNLAERAAYDAQAEGYSIYVADVGDGRAATFYKESAASGDWSDPAYVTGPVGPVPTIEAGTTTTLAPGADATFDVAPVSGGYVINVGIPAGEGFYNAGIYDVGAAFTKDDVVRHNGSSFIALQAVPIGTSPSSASPPVDTAYWQVLAAKGSDGAGTGDVVGPGGAVADRIAVFNGTTGKLLKDGGSTIAELVPAPDPTNLGRDRMVNGAMQISEENGNAAGTSSGYYAADQWATYKVHSAGTITSQRVQVRTPAGGTDRYRVTITAADTSLAAGEYLTITQNLEGLNVADYLYGTASAEASVLRFGFKGPAGTYAVSLRNSANNRCTVIPFTIAGGAANTDTIQEVAISGDTSGTWLTAEGVIGITMDIVLAAGSTFQTATANAWQAGNYMGSATISNGMGTVSAVFELFDVGYKLDIDGTGEYGPYEVPYAPFEKMKCRRFWRDDLNGIGRWSTTTTFVMVATWDVAWCKNPTAGTPTGTITEPGIANRAVTGVSVAPLAETGYTIFTTAAATNAAVGYAVSSVLTVPLSARL